MILGTRCGLDTWPSGALIRPAPENPQRGLVAARATHLAGRSLEPPHGPSEARSGDEFGGRDVQGRRDPQDGEEAGVPLAALDLAHVRSIDPGGVGEGFLRQLSDGSGIPDGATQLAERGGILRPLRNPWHALRVGPCWVYAPPDLCTIRHRFRRNSAAIVGSVEMFGKARGLLKLNEAVQIVKQALRSVPATGPIDVDDSASKYVATIYASSADLFDGKKGKTPHPVSTAGVALANALANESQPLDPDTARHVFLALGSVILDITGNREKYQSVFSDIDMKFLVISRNQYWKYEQENKENQDRILKDL